MLLGICSLLTTSAIPVLVRSCLLNTTFSFIPLTMAHLPFLLKTSTAGYDSLERDSVYSFFILVGFNMCNLLVRRPFLPLDACFTACLV